jgi:hypothetical protein
MRFKEGDEVTGSGILESLTSGLYTDNSNCIREYIQNALDAFKDIDDETKLKIEVSFINNGNTITIRDYGSGMNYDELYTAMKVGYSNKDVAKDIGWRGIGIYSGVPNFSKIIIATKKENGKKYMTSIDTNRFLNLANERTKSLREVIEECVEDIREEDDPDFKPGTLITLQDIKINQKPYFEEEAIKYRIIRTVPLKLAESLFKEKIKSFLENVGIEEPKVHIYFKGSNGKSEELFRPIINDSLFDPDSFSHYIHKDSNGNPIFAIWIVTSKYNKEIERGSLKNEIPQYKRIHHGIIYKKKLMTIGRFDAPEITVRNLYTGAFNFWNYGEIHILSDKILENTNRENFENINPETEEFFNAVSEILRQIQILNRQKSVSDKIDKIDKIKKLIEKGKFDKAKKMIKKLKSSMEGQINRPDHELLKEYSEILERRRQSQLNELNNLEQQISPTPEFSVKELEKEVNRDIKDVNIKRLLYKVKNPNKKINPSVFDGIANDLFRKTGIQKGEFIDLVMAVYGLDNNNSLDARKIKQDGKLFLMSPKKLIDDQPNKPESCQYAYKINGNIAQILIGFYHLIRNSDEHHKITFIEELYQKMQKNNEYELYMKGLMYALNSLELLVKYSKSRNELNENTDFPDIDYCKKGRKKKKNQVQP